MLKYVNNIQLSVVVRFQRGICFCLKKKVVFIHCISVLQLKRFTADLIMQLTSLKVHLKKRIIPKYVVSHKMTFRVPAVEKQ